MKSSIFLTSAFIGLSFLVVGGLGIATADSLYQELPAWAVRLPYVAVVLIGVLIGVLGFAVISRSAQPSPEFLEEETLITSLHPSMKPAYILIGIGVPLFLIGVCFLFDLDQALGMPNGFSFVISLVTIGAAVYCCWSGVSRYWINHCTTYYITDRHIIYVYQFFRMDQNRVQTEDVNGTDMHRSFLQLITGRGDVNITTGGGISTVQSIVLRDVDNPHKVEIVIACFIQIRSSPTEAVTGQ